MELEDANGERIKIKTTLEHQFHVEEWDSKVETLLADLGETTKTDGARLFPTEGKTEFGDWVKAGALKVGDEVSTLASVCGGTQHTNRRGPRIAANNNQRLTITKIERDTAATRVYNFEVESFAGEATHNYFVGDDQAWVHNAKFNTKKARNAWERYWKRDWPLDKTGNPLHVNHEDPICQVARRKYDPTNITPMFKFGHRLLHSLNGEFSRWGRLLIHCRLPNLIIMQIHLIYFNLIRVSRKIRPVCFIMQFFM